MKKSIGILGLIIIGVTYWLFFINAESPSSQKIPDSNLHPVKESKKKPQIKIIKTEKKIQKHVSAFVREVQKCFPRMKIMMPTDESYTMDWVDDALPNLLGARERNSLDWKNIHYRLQNGDERRIRVVEELTVEDKSYYQLELYKLDEQGYPEKIKLKNPKQTKNPSESMIKKIIGEGDVFYEENSYTDFYPNNYYVKRTVINNQVTDLEIHTKGRVLKCESASCECIK